MPETALSPRFTVSIDDVDLGTWTKCEGLSVEYEIFEYQEGGFNDYVHRLPGRRKYPNVKLTRPLDKGSQAVVRWITRMVTNVERTHAEITALDAHAVAFSRSSLLQAAPVKQTCPPLDTGGHPADTH